MAFSLGVVRDDIEARVNSQIAQDVYRGGVPSAEELIYTNGVLTPYVVVNFSDMAPSASRSFIGARGDGYYLMVNFMCIGPTSTIAEAIQSNLIDKMLGYKPVHSGQMNKTPGGGTFTILDANDTAVAYVAVASFRVNLLALDVTV